MENNWIRIPILLVLAWILHSYLDDPGYTSIFAGINLGFHEMGHATFMWFGNRMLTTAGGTLFEIGIPVAAAFYLLVKQRDPFGAAVCVFWMGTALVGAGVYAADARAQALPLVSPFGPVDVDSHDWTVMLLKVGRLSQDQQIGAALRGSGLFAMAVALGAGAWMVWRSFSARGEDPAAQPIPSDPGDEEARLTEFLSRPGDHDREA